MTTNSQIIPIWFYGILIISYGAATGFTSTTLPYLLRQAGLQVEAIGWYTAVTLLPSFTQFLYAPLLDIWMKRKHWFLLFSTLGTACIGLSFCLPLPQKANLVLGLVFMGQVFFGMVSSCCGGLMATTIPNLDRGRAAGFYNAGILGGMGIMVALTLSPWIQKIPLLPTFLILTLLGLPCILGIFIPEPKRVKNTTKNSFLLLFHDLWETIKSRSGWMGVLFCLSPVGSVALTNCFGSIAKDYQASQSMVAFVNGALSSLVTILGSLLGGYICDRFPRRQVYIASGLLTAFTSFVFLISPLAPTVYLLGVTAYLFVAGFVYAAFSAFILETVGTKESAASTKYALFNATENFAVTYVGVLDTRFHHAFGPRVLWGTDALLNLLGAFFLFMLSRKKWTKKRTITLLDPGGNITALVSGETSRTEHSQIARQLMEADQRIEQVGFIENPTNKDAKLRIQMMGGEFCGNAARAAAYWWCQKNNQNKVTLEVSGFSSLITATVTLDTATLILPATFIQKISKIKEGAVIDLAGIRHIIVMNSTLQGKETKLIEKYGGNQPAIGIIHVNKGINEINLTPMIWVHATQTLIQETSCASGSIAAALWLCKKDNLCKIVQPSGTIYRVHCTSNHIISIEGEMRILEERYRSVRPKKHMARKLTNHSLL